MTHIVQLIHKHFLIFIILIIPSLLLSQADTKIFKKNIIDEIKSQYLDKNGFPSSEEFRKHWGLNQIEITKLINPYLKLTFNKNDISIEDNRLILKEDVKLLGTDFFTQFINKYNSVNYADPIWDGRVYSDEGEFVVGGYSSKHNERPVGKINSQGRFISSVKGEFAKNFPILNIPSHQIVYDPFKHQLLRIIPSNGIINEERIKNFLPIELFSSSGERLDAIIFKITNDNDESIISLIADIKGMEIEIAQCKYDEAKVIDKIDGYRPSLISGCFQPGEGEVTTVTIEAEFTDNVIVKNGSLILQEEDPKVVSNKDKELNDHIYIDGEFGDWINVKGTSDYEGDFVTYLYPNPDTDLLEFKITNDEEFLYLYSRVVGAHGRTGDKGRYYWYAYIDIDADPGTGYPPTRDDNCYFGIPIGDDSEAQFEFIGNKFVKTFFGFTGLGAEKEVLSGKLELGPSYYSSTDSYGNKREKYKTEYVNREGKRFITHDYTEGTSEDIIIALSPDGSQVEMKVELNGFLEDVNGNKLLTPGQKIDIAVGVEASSDYYNNNEWGADSSPVVYGYILK